MADEVKGITVRTEYLTGLKMLTDEQRGRLFIALFADSGCCDMPDLDAMTRMVFELVIPSVRMFQANYSSRVEANRANGAKGGRPRKTENPAETQKPIGFHENPSVSEKPNGKTENPAETQKPELNRTEPNGTEESPSLSLVSPEPKTKRFIPPTPEEVQAYCDERQNGIDGQEFVDSYQSKGWMIGKTKMKDWRAAVRTWEQKRKQEEPEWQIPDWVGRGH